MGNIISDNKGSIKTGTNTAGGNISGSAFAQNMTDILFELDLLNTGKYSTATDPSNLGPRPEYDYATYATRNANGNKDLQGQPRHYDSSGNLIDMIGLKYTDKSYEDISTSTYTSDKLEFKTRYPNNPKNSISKENNKFYNIKRGFCMGTGQVPVDIVGFDAAYDDPEAHWNKSASSADGLKADQTAYQKYPASNANSKIDN